jgi:hypothetical protein
LFCGFKTEDWNFRLLFRSILTDDRRYRKKQFKSVAVQVSPESGIIQPERARRYLEEYFTGAQIGAYWGAPSDFVKDLWIRWEAKRTQR